MTVSTSRAMALYRTGPIMALVVAFGGCATAQRLGCQGDQHPVVHESLYFGADKPGGVVTLAERAAFLESTVTPRFPKGFTVLQARGQWRGEAGVIVQEASNVLEVVHQDDDASDKAVREIVAAYKSDFEQEAVLRVKSAACASF